MESGKGLPQGGVLGDNLCFRIKQDSGDGYLGRKKDIPIIKGISACLSQKKKNEAKGISSDSVGYREIFPGGKYSDELLPAFKLCCKATKAYENLLFSIACGVYDIAGNLSVRPLGLSELKYLYTEFINKGSPQQINISSTCRELYMPKVRGDEPSWDEMDLWPALDEAMTTMKDTLYRFRDSL